MRDKFTLLALTVTHNAINEEIREYSPAGEAWGFLTWVRSSTENDSDNGSIVLVKSAAMLKLSASTVVNEDWRVVWTQKHLQVMDEPVTFRVASVERENELYKWFSLIEIHPDGEDNG